MSLPRSAPPLAPAHPVRGALDGACDSHIHILGGPSDGHLNDDRVEDPAEGWTFDDYIAAWRTQREALGISRTIVVQSILYGNDNSLTARAIEALGRETTRGIALVADEASPDVLDQLGIDGFEGVRLNYVHGGVLSWEGVEAMAPRLADRGLHVQMLLDAEAHLPDLAPRFAALPVPVVLDHMAWPDLAAGVDAPGFRLLLDLVGNGQVWVKLSGIFRRCDVPFRDADAHVAALLAANPLRCLWGSDWPQIMLGGARPATPAALLDAFDRVCPDAETRQAVLVDNPARLYGF